jgi:vancomycin resistance protein YoaR
LGQVVLPNTKIDNISIDGMNKQEVHNVIQKKINELQNKKLTFLIEKKEETLTYKELDIMYEPKKLTEEIFKYQTEKNGISIFNKIISETGLKKTFYHINPTFNDKKLSLSVTQHFKKYDIDPIDASFSVKKQGQLDIITSHKGKKINIGKLKNDIRLAITNNNNKILVTFLDINPKISTNAAEAMDINHTIAEYQTSLVGKSRNVRDNIEKATKKLNNTVILPHKSFSFNDKIGPTDYAHGYESAPVIINNKLSEDAGGGVCQLSSTLYNAVLLADLNIIDRINHSYPVNYVPMGFDATVADNGPDFKFENNNDTPIIIQAVVEKDALVVRVYGEPINKEIKLNSTILSKTATEVTVNSYREIYDKKTNVGKKELIAKSFYKLH